ncbi:MAG: deoxyribonuclease IV [Bacilli bacterium]
MSLYLGSHVDLVAPDYLVSAVETSFKNGANTMMIYTGAPQNSIRKPTEIMKIQEAHQRMQTYGMPLDKVIVHAPYIINLGNTINPDTATIGVTFLIRELSRVQAMGFSTLVLHPGAHVGAGTEAALISISERLNQVFAEDKTNVTIALETMAGKGSEVGIRFEEIRYLIDHSDHPERLGVCLDTCHIHDAGYDVQDVEGTIQAFDQIIGLDKLKVIHINDSKNPRGAKKDRHENLGYGQIGFETLSRYVHHPKLAHLPKILETPWIEEITPYAKEIGMLKAKQFISGWRESLK